MLLAMALGCTPERTAPPAPTEVPVRTTPPNTPATNDELRRMITELAAARACNLIRGKWTGLRAPDRPSVTGTLWIRGCDATHDGDHGRFSISTSGWQWLDVTRKLASGTYVVRDYQRFDDVTTLSGRFELAYDEPTRTASIAFHLDELPRHQITPLPTGAPGVVVAAPPLDDAIFGAVLGAFIGRRTPDVVARSQDLRSLDITATVPLCLGVWILSVGTRRSVPEPDEVRAPVELGPRGLAMHGPFSNPESVTLVLDAEQGAPRVSLLCEQEAALLAAAFLHDRALPTPRPLATTIVRGPTRLHVAWPHCPVVMVASTTEPRTQRFTWIRPAAETATLNEPPVHCPSPPEPAMNPVPPAVPRAMRPNPNPPP